MRYSLKLVGAAGALLALHLSLPVGATPVVDAVDYARAEKVLDSSLAGAILNASVDAQ